MKDKVMREPICIDIETMSRFKCPYCGLIMDEREEFGIMRKTALYSMKEHIEKEHSYKPNYRKPKMYRSKR